jgi:hypothetical protein
MMLILRRKGKSKAPYWGAAAVAALAIVAFALVPVAEAREDGERADKMKEKREKAKDKREKMMDAAKKGRGGKFILQLNGTATDQDGNVYRVEISGDANGRARASGESGITQFRGVAKLDVKLIDANGTVLKEGQLRAKIGGKATDGEYKWHLIAGKNRAMPKLGLRGSATPIEAGGFDLAAQGKAVVKLGDERSVLELNVTGTLMPK